MSSVVMIQRGSMVRFARMPAWVAELPEESRRVFGFCLGRIYRVREIDGQGLAVLDVSADIDHRFGGFLNDIRLEAEFLEEVPGVARR
jgi:hypothetical protein